MDWRLYADRSRFNETPKQRFFVIQGAIQRREGRSLANWHVFLETCNFDAAWGVAMAPESFGFALTLAVAGGGAAIGTCAHAIGNFAEAFRGC